MKHRAEFDVTLGDFLGFARQLAYMKSLDDKMAPKPTESRWRMMVRTLKRYRASQSYKEVSEMLYHMKYLREEDLQGNNVEPPLPPLKKVEDEEGQGEDSGGREGAAP